MVEKSTQKQDTTPIGALPTHQWALQLHGPGLYSVDRVPLPTPAPGQVLVRIECAPINPSDTYFMSGMYKLYTDDPNKVKYPMAPGWEGAGVVVANGGGIMGWRLVGKRVAVTRCREENRMFSIGGCYQQYMITTAMQCLPLPDTMSLEQGSMHFVNPLSALGLLDTAKTYKTKAIVQTAAASQLGKMVVHLCKEEKIPLINIVRRDEQVKMLSEIGAEYVLDSSQSGFGERLKELADKLQATVLFEAVGGETTAEVLEQLPYNSVCIIYGLLSEKPISNLDPLLLIGRNQRLEGFFLGHYLTQKSIWGQLSLFKKCTQLMSSGLFKSDVAKRVSLFEIKDAIMEYKANMSKGKYIVYPQQEPTPEDMSGQQ
ncbi:hypothetical protein FGO68_gene2007 [Halteria grandinella]|uniref:Enoyl reductase (ER) domain-containing protein n=1 Tax=Halteria grandinella TaxID=5974 RepID=A0A8J8NLK0_HALGN|nr:hypothetical protein FGO68_gene2007 [Halteria grandinella]